MDPRAQRVRVVVAGGLLLGLSMLLPNVTTPTPARAADVGNGRYIAQTACMECHSERAAGNPYQLDASRLFGGGEEFSGPWGTVFSRNISSDRETGIGAWSDAELKRALTEGISRDGTKLVLMPWQHFRGMSQSDLDDVVAFLKSTPPVSHRVPAAQLAPAAAVGGFISSVPPLRARVPESLYGSPRDVFHDFVMPTADEAVPPAAAGFVAPQGRDSRARGEYLARVVLGCTACHSSNLAGGAPPFFAPNITPDRETGVGAWSKEDLVRLLREGRKPNGALLSPAMPAAALGYGHLTDDDVYNVITFLQSLPAVRRAQGQPNPLFAPPPGAAAGAGAPAAGGPPAGGPPAGGPPAGGAPTALPNTGDAVTPWLGGSLLVALFLGLGGWVLRRRTA